MPKLAKHSNGTFMYVGFHVGKRVPKIIFETCSRDFVKVTSETGNALIRRLTFIPGTSHPIEDGQYMRDISCFRGIFVSGTIRVIGGVLYQGRHVLYGTIRVRDGSCWDDSPQGQLVQGRLVQGQLFQGRSVPRLTWITAASPARPSAHPASSRT